MLFGETFRVHSDRWRFVLLFFYADSSCIARLKCILRGRICISCSSEARFHKLQFWHVIIYRNKRHLLLQLVSNHYLRRPGALVIHQLSRKDTVTRHSGWQPSCARKTELSKQHNCSWKKYAALDPLLFKVIKTVIREAAPAPCNTYLKPFFLFTTCSH